MLKFATVLAVEARTAEHGQEAIHDGVVAHTILGTDLLATIPDLRVSPAAAIAAEAFTLVEDSTDLGTELEKLVCAQIIRQSLPRPFVKIQSSRQSIGIGWSLGKDLRSRAQSNQ